MIRQRCSAIIDYKQCTKVYRTRLKYPYCRECTRRITESSRPILSRANSDNKYRRNRKRRGITARAVPKVIVNRNSKKANKNAIS